MTIQVWGVEPDIVVARACGERLAQTFERTLRGGGVIRYCCAVMFFFRARLD